MVRGPLQNGFIVRPLLDPDREGAYRGSAKITRDYPFLKAWGKLGRFESGEIRHPMLHGQWQASQMNVENEAGDRVGLRRNIHRRTKVLYELPKTGRGLPEAFIDSVVDLLKMPEREVLEVLNGFHPTVNRGRCELDEEVVERLEVNRLIDTPGRRGLISRLPQRLEQIFQQREAAASGM